MIRLELEHYCQDCPFFSEESQKLFYGYDSCDTIILCTHRGMCENLYKRFTAIDKLALIPPEGEDE